MIDEEHLEFLSYFWLIVAVAFDVVVLYCVVKLVQNSEDFIVKSRYFSVLLIQAIAIIFIITLALTDPYVTYYNHPLSQILCFKTYLPAIYFPFLAIPYICRIFRIIRVYRYTELKQRSSTNSPLGNRRSKWSLSFRGSSIGTGRKGVFFINLTNEKNVLIIMFVVFFFIVVLNIIELRIERATDISTTCTFLSSNVRGKVILPIEYCLCVVIYLYFVIDLHSIQDVYGVAKELKIVGWYIIVSSLLQLSLILYALETGYSVSGERWYAYVFFPLVLLFTMAGPIIISYIWMHRHFICRKYCLEYFSSSKELLSSSTATAKNSTRRSIVDRDQGWTIERILETPLVLDAFQETAKKRLCAENLDFLVEVLRFQNMRSAHLPIEEYHRTVDEIIDNFIDQQALNEVNISSASRKLVMKYKDFNAFKKLMESDADNKEDENSSAFDIFESAYIEVSAMLSRNLLKPFLSSNEFTRLCMLYNFENVKHSPKKRQSFAARGSLIVKGVDNMRKSINYGNLDGKKVEKQKQRPTILELPTLSQSQDQSLGKRRSRIQ